MDKEKFNRHLETSSKFDRGLVVVIGAGLIIIVIAEILGVLFSGHPLIPLTQSAIDLGQTLVQAALILLVISIWAQLEVLRKYFKDEG